MAYEERLVDLDHLEGAVPDEDLAQLQAATPLVDRFVRETHILDRIDQRFFADGLVDKVIVFQYVGPGYGEERTAWWVVAGDLPPFIDAVRPGETAVDALRTYCQLIRLALEPSKDTEGLLEDFPPLSYDYSTTPIELTDEIKRMIESHIGFIEDKLIPWMLSGSHRGG